MGLTEKVKRKDRTMENTTAVQSWEERAAAYIAKAESCSGPASKELIAEGYGLLPDDQKKEFRDFLEALLAEQEAQR